MQKISAKRIYDLQWIHGLGSHDAACRSLTESRSGDSWVEEYGDRVDSIHHLKITLYANHVSSANAGSVSIIQYAIGEHQIERVRHRKSGRWRELNKKQ